MKRSQLSLFVLLLVIGAIGSASVLPYTFTLMELSGTPLPYSTTVILLAYLAQSAVILSLTIATGMFFTKKLGWKLTYLAPLVTGTKHAGGVWRMVGIAAILGIVVGILTALLELTAFGTTSETMRTILVIPAWQRLLAAVYRGIVEELIMRYFLLSFIAWIALSLLRKLRSERADVAAWIGIVVSSILISYSQYVLSRSGTSFQTSEALRALIFGGATSVVFGYVYWKQGLEAAIIAHFSSRIVTYVALPVVLGLV